MRITILLLLATVACVPGPEPEMTLPGASYVAFVDVVQPIYERRCANPSCHGLAGRPLEIYAPKQHRLDMGRVHMAEPLGDDELVLNYWRTRGFLIDAPTPGESQLLSKPLAESAGGSAHIGGAQFEDATEDEYHLLLQWVAESKEDES